MKTKLMTTVLSLFFLAGSVLAQTDQPKAQHMPKWRNAKGANELKLTDDQKKDIQKIKYDLMQKQIDIRAKLEHARLDYGQLTGTDSPDEDAIASKIDEIAKLQTQLKKNLLDGWFTINKILTPDQQKIWKKVLQHPGIAKRRIMARMRTNRMDGSGRMMQWNRPGMGERPLPENGMFQMNGDDALGEETGNATNFDGTDELGSMTEDNMFYLDDDPLSDELEVFDEPMMNKMDMMDQNGMMDMQGPNSFMKNRMEIMKKMMDQNSPDTPVPDSSK